MLDFTKSYRVEMRANPNEPTGLGKEGMSKFPGTMQVFSVSRDNLSGRYRTGLDVNAPEVKKMEVEAQKKKIEWITETKKALEDQIGTEGALDATNGDFWDLWKIQIEVGEDKKVRLEGSHPQFEPGLHYNHLLALITLEANNSIPLSKREANDPKHKSSLFYLTTSEEEEGLAKVSNQVNRKRNVEMSKLFDDGNDNFERASRIAYILGIQKEPCGVDMLENIMEAFTPQKEYLQRFLDLCKASDSELAVKVTVKKAIDYDIIRFNPEFDLYYRGSMNFKKTTEETVTYFVNGMAEPLIAKEFSEISEEVRKRDSKKKKKTSV